MFFKVITTIAVTVPVFVLAAQTPDPLGEGVGIAIPLIKRSDTDEREFHATSHNAKIIRGPSGMDSSERNTGTPHPSAVQPAGSGAGVDLTKDEIWYGTISIGTPSKSFTVQFNTGSSDLIVPVSTGDENCRSHPNLWDPASSHVTDLDLNTPPPSNVDLNTDFEIIFSDGRYASGKQYTDNVTILGFTADIQTIGAATTYSSTMAASKFAANGILGLAFPSFSYFRGQSPLLHTLYNEGKLSQPVFSLKLTSSGGELYVGGTNEALYLHYTLVFTPVTDSAALWTMRIDDIRVGGNIVLTDVPAIIDTGSNLIFGDSVQALALHKAGGGSVYDDHYYTFPCRSFPSMSFTIGGSSFSMPAQALNKGRVVKRSPNCFSGIASVEDIRFWSIGTIFLQQFYTVFDFNSESPRIGFAELTAI